MNTGNYIVRDSLGKMEDRPYFTPYHAEQYARALNLYHAMYYGTPRFVVVTL